MKKFIIFVLILVVSVSLGATVFYFMRDNEELVVDCAPSLFVNKDEHFEIDAQLKNAKIGNEVIITSLHPNVLEWNPALGFEAKVGGAAVIEIKTKNDKIPAIYIEVRVGDGSLLAPWYIDSEEDLLKIGEGAFESSDNYILMQDISFTTSITPILNSSEFKGAFNGNGFAIKDLSIASGQDIKNAGLFAKVANSGVITNLTVSNVNINGEFENAGAIAGINLGTINRCNVLNGNVASTLADSNVGGISGTTKYSNSNMGRIDRCFSNLSVSGTYNVGGLTGLSEGAILINSYVALDDTNTIKAIADGANVGGLVGTQRNLDSEVAVVKNCYSLATVIANDGVKADTVKLASLIGYNDEISETRPNYIMGVYTDNSDLALMNNEFNLNYTADQNAKKSNYRGVYNTFPKDNGQILANEIKSYVGKKLTSETYDVFWDFVNVWLLDSSLNNGYPILNEKGANVPDDINVVYDPSIIKTATDLINLSSAVNSGNNSENYYILDADIVLTGEFIPIGTKKNPFNGTFDGNGHKITGLNISSSTINAMQNDEKYVGLFGRIGTDSTVKNLTLEDVKIADGSVYAAGVVAYNEGTIQNVTIKNSNSVLNKSVDNISASYSVGGISALNLGLIENCKVVNQTIALKPVHSDAARFNGGIAGINGIEISSSKAIIRNCAVIESYCYDNEQKSSYDSDAEYRGDDAANTFKNGVLKSLNKIVYYVAGISGVNYYQITSNYVHNTDLEANSYADKGAVAGIVGLSKSSYLLSEGVAEVSYNKVLGGTFKGFAVAGLMNKQFGLVNYNHVEAEKLIGTTVAGLVNTITFDGRLTNCFVKSHLVGNGSWGTVAGMTNHMDYSVSFFDSFFGASNERYGAMYQIFSACTFDSESVNAYYDSTASYRRGQWLKSNREFGYANQLIWEETGFAKAQKANDWVTYTNDVTGISSEEAKLIIEQDKTIALFTSYGFDLEAWSFNKMSYPTLLGLPEIN